MFIFVKRQDRRRALTKNPRVIPSIAGVTKLQEVGRNAELIGYVGVRDAREIILEMLREEADRSEWFFRSATLQSRLAQPAIPPFLEIGLAEGRPYRIREYVQGRPAQELLSDGPLAEDRLIAMARTVAAALKAVHQRGFVFGHLTLDHLRVDRSGIFRLVDTGQCISRGALYEASRKESLAPTLIRQTQAPELVEGEPIECACDLYSLGCMVLDLAVGYPVPPERRERTLQGLDLRPSFHRLLALLLGPVEERPSASSVLIALLHLEEWDAKIRLDQVLPCLPTEEFLHPYPLCGREEEFRQLQQAWTQAQGRSHSIYLLGKEKSGRSRLVEELRRGLSLKDQRRLRVCRGEPNEQFDGLTVILLAQDPRSADSKATVELNTLPAEAAVHLAESFLNSRLPESLRWQLNETKWLPGHLLEQLERWCDEGKLRPYWGHWHFGSDTSQPEPIRLTAHYQPLESKTLERFVISLEELQSARRIRWTKFSLSAKP